MFGRFSLASKAQSFYHDKETENIYPGKDSTLLEKLKENNALLYNQRTSPFQSIDSIEKTLDQKDTNIGEKVTGDIETCLLHSLPADLLCIEDECIICCKCALFGEHKGHEVEALEDGVFKLTQLTEKALKIS